MIRVYEPCGGAKRSRKHVKHNDELFIENCLNKFFINLLSIVVKIKFIDFQLDVIICNM